MTRRLPLLVTLLAAVVGVCACGGQSKSDKAKSQVCDARADISKQVNELSGLTVATASVSGVKDNVSAIQNDLKKIKDAQSDLSPDRRSQVKQATDTFVASVTSIAQGLTSNLSLSEAKTQLTSAAKDLRAAYSQSLGKVDCS